MQHLQNTASEFCRARYGFIDPATLVIIVQLIVSLVQVVQECRKVKKLRWRDVRNAGKTAIGRRRCYRAAKRRVGEMRYEQVGGDEAIDNLIEKSNGLLVAEIEPIMQEALNVRP